MRCDATLQKMSSQFSSQIPCNWAFSMRSNPFRNCHFQIMIESRLKSLGVVELNRINCLKATHTQWPKWVFDSRKSWFLSSLTLPNQFCSLENQHLDVFTHRHWTGIASEELRCWRPLASAKANVWKIPESYLGKVFSSFRNRYGLPILTPCFRSRKEFQSLFHSRAFQIGIAEWDTNFVWTRATASNRNLLDDS